MIRPSERKKIRKKQRRINSQLKKKILKGLEFSNCCYCNQSFPTQELTIEHKVPICMGGTSELSNIDVACAPCNRQKGKEAWFAILTKRKERQWKLQQEFNS